MQPINVKAIAEESGVPYRLVGAIIHVESGGAHWAVRYEPGYRWLWNVRDDEPFTLRKGWSLHPELGAPFGFPAPTGVTPATEFHAQRTSWGLMQVMGATARELGFSAPYLSALCDPRFGIRYGCRYLAALRERHGIGRGDREALAAAYNAGAPRHDANGEWRNQPYVEKVRAAGGFR